MAREATYQAIIIKRQPYGEGDEILTVFAKQAGKLRALAKSTKLPKSKLRSNLQTLFMVNLTVTSVSALPKIIRVEPLKSFSHITDDLVSSTMAFYALELLLKFTADGQKNERLFDLVADFFEYLDRTKESNYLAAGLAKFKIGFLDSVGLGIHYETPEGYAGEVGFSNSRGGFVFGEQAADHRRVALETLEQYMELSLLSFARIPEQAAASLDHDIKPLQELLSSFIKYHLERDISSEKYLNQGNMV